MASISQGAVPRPKHVAAGRNGFLKNYFYLAMSLVFAAIVVFGFGQSVNANLFHAVIPRPLLLWIHGAAFSLWVVFYIFQSALVRTRNVKLHRTLGWFGVGLAATMVVLGYTIAVIMARFDKFQLHMLNNEVFLSVPFFDMTVFAVMFALAIYWRRKPELHRRLLFLATCSLMDAPFGRFEFLFNHSLFFPCLDLVMLLGVARDLVVDRRVHPVYRYALPVLFVSQALVVYLWRGTPAWWESVTHAIVG